ncbi:hypothetical protein HY061_02670, partial [Candidatus Azambacteria bacterium]|nr:hypothetical protein [Candidatus Azambacteria bacterium]
MQIIREVLEVVFPKGLFEWFDLIKAQSDENNVFITLEEKDIPPLTEAIKDK